ncbi:MAG: hypothetical protein QXG00_08130 [Candidatus Woesearchaeota archaeon]
MENHEINSMKDDLYMLGYELQETRDGEMLSKVINYINNLEEKLVEIANSEDRAINLLGNKGYVVKKITKSMEEDYEECEKCGYNGDCMSCACSICIMQ